MIKYLIGWIKNLINPATSLFVKIDNRSIVNRHARVNTGVKLTHASVNEYSYIGKNTSLVHASIGKYCSIAGECCIGMATHTTGFLSSSPVFTERHNGVGVQWVNSTIVSPYKDIVIGNDVWIGLRAIIIGGVHIGNGAVIGAGAIVTKDVPPYAIVAGIPARIIRFRFPDDDISALEAFNWWDLPSSVLRNNIDLFQKESPNIKEVLNALSQ